MEFRLKRAATPYDIPLAYISMVEVSANSVIQIQDFSSYLDGNASAAFRSINTYPTTGNRLLTGNYFGKILLTDEYYYDNETGSEIALWFAHHLKTPYYSPNAMARTSTKIVRTDKVLTDRIVTGLIPSSGNYVIATGSVKVYKKNTSLSSYEELDRDSFYMNYSIGSLIVAEDAMYHLSVPIHSFKIEYIIVPVDIIVTSQLGAPYRIELIQINPMSLEYFSASILTVVDEQLYVQYRSRLNTGSIGESREYTTAVPIFDEVEESVRSEITSDSTFDIDARRVYSLVDNSIYVTDGNTDHEFTYKPKYITSTRVNVKKPYVGDFTSEWQLRISAGDVSNSDGEYSVSPSGTEITVKEPARIIDKNTIAVSGTDLAVMLKADGSWSGIYATKRSNGLELDIEAVDAKHGVLIISQDVSRKEIIDVEYSMHTNDLILKTPCVSPMPHHSGTHSEMENKAAILFVIDSRRTPPERPNSIYIKYINKLSGNRPVTFTYAMLDQWYNSDSQVVRNAYRSDMGLPSDYTGSELIRIEPLAIVQTVNPLDSDAYEIGDMRVLGGGYSERQYSFHDYSLYDGENTDMESSLVIEIPQWVKDDLKARAKLWDIDVLKSDAESQDTHAEARAMEIIREKVKKYSMLGTTQEIVIGTKTITDNS